MNTHHDATRTVMNKSRLIYGLKVRVDFTSDQNRFFGTEWINFFGSLWERSSKA